MSEKPLYVLVAEAMGLPHVGAYRRKSIHSSGWEPCDISDHTPDTPHWKADWYWSHDGVEPDQCIPRYDTDWSVTGPLIERFGIGVEPDHPDDFGRAGFKGWYALREHDTPILDATGATPLEAVCRLILRLKDAGKLEG